MFRAKVCATPAALREIEQALLQIDLKESLPVSGKPIFVPVPRKPQDAMSPTGVAKHRKLSIESTTSGCVIKMLNK
jgi:hypothetical protein